MMAEADPTKRYNIHEAKTHLSKLVAQAEAGRETVIARGGKPVAKLVPFTEAAQPRKPGRWPELRNIPSSIWFDPMPEDELAAWEGKYSNML
jgi:prevent-host-death family protein